MKKVLFAALAAIIFFTIVILLQAPNIPGLPSIEPNVIWLTFGG